MSKYQKLKYDAEKMFVAIVQDTETALAGMRSFHPNRLDSNKRLGQYAITHLGAVKAVSNALDNHKENVKIAGYLVVVACHLCQYPDAALAFSEGGDQFTLLSVLTLHPHETKLISFGIACFCNLLSQDCNVIKRHIVKPSTYNLAINCLTSHPLSPSVAKPSCCVIRLLLRNGFVYGGPPDHLPKVLGKIRRRFTDSNHIHRFDVINHLVATHLEYIGDENQADAIQAIKW